MATGSLDVLLGKLKSWQPTHLSVTCASGEKKVVAVQPTGTRRRWLSLENTMSQIDWVSVDALCGEGTKERVVGVCENSDFEEENDELEDLEMRDSKLVSETARMMQIMLKGQDVALSRHGKEVGQAMECLVRVVGIQGKRLEHLEKVYASNVTMVQTMVRKLGGVGDDDVGGFSGDAIMGLLEMFAGNRRAAPPNGAPTDGD